METDKEIEAAVLKYLGEQTYASNMTDWLAIAAEASYGLLLAERDRLQRENAALREAIISMAEGPRIKEPSLGFAAPITFQAYIDHIDRVARAAIAAVPADARGEEERLLRALRAIKHARDLEIETGPTPLTDRAWIEGWRQVEDALDAVPADGEERTDG